MASSFSFPWIRKKREEVPSQSLLGEELFLKVSYECLHKATDGFAKINLVGAGSFGIVYKGVLDQNELIAVKVLNLHRQGASKSFMAECKALRYIRHRNLVNMVSSCSSIDFEGNNFKALVYKFMPNGNLGSWLHPNSKQTMDMTLNLQQRINIAINVACALDYLHNQCSKPIIHCDLKPSNILLDTEMVAHVGDFGLTRFLPEFSDTNQASLIKRRGTIGYAAPEYSLGSEASRKGDVYSYGILLLEMMTGRKPTDPMFEDGLNQDSFAAVALPGIILLEVLTGKRPVLEDSLNLHGFAKAALPDRVMEILDPVLRNSIEEEGVVGGSDDWRKRRVRNGDIMKCMISIVRIGVACSMESPQDRMEISKAIQELRLVKDILEGT